MTFDVSKIGLDGMVEICFNVTENRWGSRRYLAHLTNGRVVFETLSGEADTCLAEYARNIKQKKEGWINLYRDVVGELVPSRIHPTESEAHYNKSEHECFGCVRIEWEE